MNTLLTSWRAKALDFVFPRRCAICNRPVDRPDRHLCADCLNRLPWVGIEGNCRICGRDIAANVTFVCTECQARRPAFDRAASALHFLGDARDLINRMKFQHAFYLFPDAIDWLESAYLAHFANQKAVLMALPSTWRRRWIRGFAFTEYLARGLAKRMGLPLVHCLGRVGNPKRQGSLDERDRLTNVRGTFVYKAKSPAPESIILVDDILTTGSTLSAAAEALKAAGVRTVFGLTLARSTRT